MFTYSITNKHLCKNDEKNQILLVFNYFDEIKCKYHFLMLEFDISLTFCRCKERKIEKNIAFSSKNKLRNNMASKCRKLNVFRDILRFVHD